jgi:sialate O-acetylesterase
MFSDHMVLQRNAADAIFGTATPNTQVFVQVAGQSASATAGADGRWMAHLQPMPAGGPYQMTITGDGTVTFKDVMVGEVWLASGQSNMEFRERDADDFAQAKTEADPAVRMFTVGRNSAELPQAQCKGDWELAGAEGIGYFSAVAYSFAAELHRRLRVPVGILQSSWGGTTAEAWTSREGLDSDLSTRPIIESYLDSLTTYDQRKAAYEDALNAWYAGRTDGVNQGFIDGWASENFNDSAWQTVALPNTIRSIEGKNRNGAFWFRRTFELPPSMEGKTLLLEIGKIDHFDRTYVNGQMVGMTDAEQPNAFVTPRIYNVPAAALHSGTNSLAIRVFNPDGAGGFTSDPTSMKLEQVNHQGDVVHLDGDWKYKPEHIAEPDTPRPVAPIGPGSALTPGGLYNGMIAPLVPYAIRGAIWYQGEANVGQAATYRKLFPVLIADWRRQWGEGDFPFLFVQLPNYLARKEEPTDSDWAELRDAQTAALKLPNTGMATTIDLGSPDTIHPTNKRPVGERLCDVAMFTAYHDKMGVPAGPVFRSATFPDDKAWVQFDTFGHGLKVTDDRPPTGFALAGADHIFHWANAKIVGIYVIVSSPDVPHPIAVRYGWANNPDVNLVDSLGMPASPFRSDDWPTTGGEN